jgi:hypothetical protein
LHLSTDGISSGAVSNKSNPIAAHSGLCLRSANNPDGPALRELIFGIMREYQLGSNPPYDADLNNLEEHYVDGYLAILETENTIVDSVAFSPRAIAQ